MNTTTLLIIIIAIYLVGIVLIDYWIYKDAKAREMNPWGWILLTSFLSPNFIGVIAYLLYRRKDTEVNCSKCQERIVQSMNYCPWCGTVNDKKKLSVPPNPSNRFLVAGIIIMVMGSLAILGICVTQLT